jgi:hypothetical protein
MNVWQWRKGAAIHSWGWEFHRTVLCAHLTVDLRYLRRQWTCCMNTISVKMGDFADFWNLCYFWKIYILARFEPNLAWIELNNKKLYIYLSHFVKFGTWNFSILMEMVFMAHAMCNNRSHSNWFSRSLKVPVIRSCLDSPKGPHLFFCTYNFYVPKCVRYTEFVLYRP